jgi:lipoate-protein ligase A
VSLGYFQRFADLRRQGVEVRRLPVVRRPTGGGAILHAEELTYCLVVPRRGAPEAGPFARDQAPEAGWLYHWMHSAIAEAVGRLAGEARTWHGCPGQGPMDYVPRPAGETPAPQSAVGAGAFWCFARRALFDLLVGGDKLVGSAQRRTAFGVLQHGSVILDGTFAEQPGASVREVLGRRVSFEELADSLLAVLRDRSAGVERGEWSRAERELAEDLRRKYASEVWLRRR